MKAKLNYNKKQIEIPDIKECKGIFKAIGLMFHTKNTSARLFQFKTDKRIAIHSLFCPSFLAIWLDEKNKILEYKLVFPSEISLKPQTPFRKLLEIPVNNKYSKIISFFLGDKKDLNTPSS